jgi:hypothetical protein
VVGQESAVMPKDAELVVHDGLAAPGSVVV